MKRICGLFLLILVSLVSVPAFALGAFDGIELGRLEVNGKSYLFPLVEGQDRSFAVSTNDLYYLKKSFTGDKIAREVLLNNKKERWFYIGLESPLWLRLTETSQEVLETKGD